MSKLEEFKRKAAEKKRAKNASFLEENAARKEVISLDSGLLYEVLVQGDGKVSPKPKDWVTANYHGTLIDGKVFDSSVEKNKPATFKLNNLIKGWQELLSLMVVGDKWKAYVPPHLAYGDRQEGKIPSNSILVFEIELIKIGK